VEGTKGQAREDGKAASVAGKTGPTATSHRRRRGMVEEGVAAAAAPRVPPESPLKETTRGLVPIHSNQGLLPPNSARYPVFVGHFNLQVHVSD
jgi:hypothetical protein